MLMSLTVRLNSVVAVKMAQRSQSPSKKSVLHLQNQEGRIFVGRGWSKVSQINRIRNGAFRGAEILKKHVG